MSVDGVVYFNNCRERDHVQHYGREAFYDLLTEGVQANQATNLRRGQKCVVATSVSEGKVAFDWYSFQRKSLRRDKDGVLNRVFFGKHLKAEKLTRAKATRHKTYSVFFNVNGHFKRQSTISLQ